MDLFTITLIALLYILLHPSISFFFLHPSIPAVLKIKSKILPLFRFTKISYLIPNILNLNIFIINNKLLYFTIVDSIYWWIYINYINILEVIFKKIHIKAHNVRKSSNTSKFEFSFLENFEILFINKCYDFLNALPASLLSKINLIE